MLLVCLFRFFVIAELLETSLEGELIPIGGGNVDSRGVELVGVWIDPSIDEQIEVCCCALHFFVQYLMADDGIESLSPGDLSFQIQCSAVMRCFADTPSITECECCVLQIISDFLQLQINFPPS